jgi:hypothetical protein
MEFDERQARLGVTMTINGNADTGAAHSDHTLLRRPTPATPRVCIVQVQRPPVKTKLQTS